MTEPLRGGFTTEDRRLDRLPQYDERLVAVAWLAGIYEGEGCCSTDLNARSVTSACIRIRMTDEDVVRRCHAVAGVGTVTGPRPGRGNRQPTWEWSVYRREDVLAVLTAIRPLLGQRRGAKADEAIAQLRLGDRRRTPVEHGTLRGYARHHRAGTPVCDACRAASRNHARRRRAMAKTGGS